MVPSPNPSYGDRPPLQSYRRSFTAPHRSLSYHEKAGLDRSDASAEVLYSHPAARIVSFSPPTDSISSSASTASPDTDYPVDTIETLPWRSRTETLAARGLMIIEKVRGSTNFLKSGDVMHAILRNSQCWCVDGESKFVLRVRKFQYYRIELPTATVEDKAKVEELKDILNKIMRFERTPCPFKRGFHVDLPDDAITPRRKKAWQRTESSLPTTPDTESPSLRRTKNSRAWSFQRVGSGQSTNPVSPLAFEIDNSPKVEELENASHATGLDGSTSPSSTTSSTEDLGSGEQQPSEGSESDEKDELQSDHASTRPSTASGELSHHKSAADEGQLSVSAVADEESAVVHDEVASITTDVAKGLGEEMPMDLPSNAQPEESVRNIGVGGEISDGSRLEQGTREPEPDEVDPESEKAIAEAKDLGEEPEQSTREPLQSELEYAGSSVQQLDHEDDSAEVTTVPPNAEILSEVDDQEVEAAARVVEDDVTVADGPSTTDNVTIETEAIEASLPEHAPHAQGLDQTEHESTGSESASQHEPDPLHMSDTKDVEVNALSTVSSVDSFYTLASSASNLAVERPAEFLDLETTPPAEQRDPLARIDHQHKRGLSEMTVTAWTVDELLMSDKADGPNVQYSEGPRDKLASLSHLQSTSTTFSAADMPKLSSLHIQNGLRNRLKSRRSHSTSPSSPGIFSPPQHNQGNHLTSDILYKACNVALVKPVEVMILLVHILARIAGGATVNDLMSGDLFKRPEQHRRNPSFPDQLGRMSRDFDEDEDDFGVPIRGRDRERSRTEDRDDETDSLLDLD